MEKHDRLMTIDDTVLATGFGFCEPGVQIERCNVCLVCISKDSCETRSSQQVQSVVSS